jgi:N4-gp56 family major capsid protein
MATNIATGSNQAQTLQAYAIFAATMQRLSNLGRMAGPFPTAKETGNKLRVQSSSGYPIVRCKDLQKVAGDNVTFDLVNPIYGKPIMGGATAEGKGEAMNFSQDSLKINQTRKPVSAGDTMSQQRTDHELKELARASVYGYMPRLEDQLCLVHLAGARGFQDNVEWVVPLAADADFSSICVNTVQAPSNNRHFMSTGSGIEAIAASGNDITIETTDTMNIDVVDGIAAYLDDMALPPAPCVFKGDEMAIDSPLRVLLVSTLQYNDILQSTNFRTLQSNAMSRAAHAKNLALYRGDAGLWNGILIVKMPKAIRFYANDPINWCASATSETETTTDLVPAGFSTTHAVDRALLLGSQALGEAFGKSKQNGQPYFWSEKLLDHGDKLEVLLGMINGKSKIRFSVDHGTGGDQPTDYGVMAIDTAVTLQGV